MNSPRVLDRNGREIVVGAQVKRSQSRYQRGAVRGEFLGLGGDRSQGGVDWHPLSGEPAICFYPAQRRSLFTRDREIPDLEVLDREERHGC